MGLSTMPTELQTVERRQRRSFSRIPEVLELPDLIEIQRRSYKWFLEHGLAEMFEDISPIQDFTGNLVLEFAQPRLEEPKHSIEDCKDRDATYSAPLKVKVRLINKETGEVKEQEVFMGDFPLMTENGTFIINGAERVVVSQLVRSPGVYYDDKDRDADGKILYKASLIPNRGAWLEFEVDSSDVIYVRVDRTRKLPATVLLRAMGVASDAKILELVGESEPLKATLERDTTASTEEALLEIYKRLRPGEPPSEDSARTLFNTLFGDPKRYDLAGVGRYKINKKLRLMPRIAGRVLVEPIAHPETGEILAEAGQRLDRRTAEAIDKAGVTSAVIEAEGGLALKVVSNGAPDLTQRTLTAEDLVAVVNYIIGLMHGVGQVDDIDHLGNRRLKSVGELLQNQFRIGLSRMERVVRERMTIQDTDIITPQALINIRPVVAAIKEFFGSSQLSQFMDQTNPLAELTHKRRLSALGPGGLSRERAGFEVRDVHHSHYGRMCPIETPEGPNIGLIGSLTTYARVNEYGFIETPYRRVDKGRVTDEIVYLTADEEDKYVIAQANEPFDPETRHFLHSKVSVRYKEAILVVPAEQVDFMDVSPKQLVSIATALIPFLENDDANRALMGSNMQRQAVPLLKTEAPFVGTGMESKVAYDSGAVVVCRSPGEVIRVTSTEIIVRRDEDPDGLNYRINGRTGERFEEGYTPWGRSGLDIYVLQKFKRSNQGTCINQQPIVTRGQKVEAGEVIADGACTNRGELALGRNVLTA